jgi:hypothetical protein
MAKTASFSQGVVVRSRTEVDARFVVVSRDDYNERSLTRTVVPMHRREQTSPFDVYSGRYDMVVASTSPMTLRLSRDQYIVEGKVERRILSEVIENLVNHVIPPEGRAAPA